METFTCSPDNCNDIPKNITHLFVIAMVELPAQVFSGLRRLVQVNLSEGLSSIGEAAFQRCVSLRKLKIPSTVKAIGDYAMDDCRALKEVNLPDGLEKLGEFAFSNCSSLQRIKIPSGVDAVGLQTFHYCTSLMEVCLEEGVREIGWEAFFNCSSLRTVELASTMKMIDAGAFYQCFALADITFPEGLKAIGKNSFGRCKSLEWLRIPASIESVGNAAFSECISLMEVDLPEGLKEIAASVFEGCVGLSRIKLPGSVEIIQDRAFRGCKSLMEVDLQPGLIAIGKEAFMCCFSLHAMSLPSTLERIGQSSFRECGNLVNVEVPPKPNICIAFDAFPYCHDLRIIVVSMILDSNLADWFAEWRIRFKCSPVHRCCYYASMTTAGELREVLDNDHTLLDVYGMTPFHVLLSSAKPRVDLLEVLLDFYPPGILANKDKMDMNAVDYLVCNWKVESKIMMAMYLRRWMIDWLRTWGAQIWLDDVKSRVSNLLEEGDHSSRKSILKEVCLAFARYQKLASVVNLELALWKRELAVSQNRNGAKRLDMDRGICRALCGTSAVIPNVLQYLGS
ncbi:MAG: hypothetical protein SGBAC_007628 [Bacillariaceae sp.]